MAARTREERLKLIRRVNCCGAKPVQPLLSLPIGRNRNKFTADRTGCITKSFRWDIATQDIDIDLTIPFNPALSFNPPPTEVVTMGCKNKKTPRFSKCVFAQPGLNHADPNLVTIDPFAIERTSEFTYRLAFACPFVGEICFQFCCQNCPGSC